MVKKKKASDPSENGGDSTESCDENVKSACPHITKAVFLGKLKKHLKANGFEKECAECKVMTKTEVSDPDFEEDLSLWMCLRCGTQLCGRSRNKHALEHYSKVHSDPHSLTANTTSWEVYCYECDHEVPVSSSRKLNECIEFVKKEMQTFVGKPAPLPPIELYFESRKADLMLPVENLIKIDKHKDKATSMNLPRVRGLTNLGNTCFFNSVMQCLVQTPYLLQVLREMATPGEKFTLPGGKLKLKGEGDSEGKEVDLPPITGQLAEWGALTRTLAETLAELQAGEGGVYTPRRLLSALVSKLPQFDGGDQHDSHELLRHLLEAVRSEDLRRYQAVILSSLGMSSKVDPAKVDGEVKQKVKFYGQQASDTMLRPEQVFRGFLVSTLECQECLNTSERAEYFLDLSLPVAACRPQPPALWRRKPAADETTHSTQEENKPSKHQLKKEKKNMKKRQRGPKDRSGHAKDGTDAVNGDAKDDGKSSSEQSDADVEDNLEDAPKHNDTHTASVGTQAIAHTASNFAAYHMDGAYEYDITTTSTYHSSPDLGEKADSTPEYSDKDKCKEDTKRNHAYTALGQSILPPAANFYNLHKKETETENKVEKRDLDVRDTASNFAAYHLTYDFKKENSPENAEKSKVNFVNSATSTMAIPLEYKPLISLENLSNPDSGVASPETTKHNSTETVDNVDSPVNGKELGSHSSLSSEVNLDMSSPQHHNSSPDKDFEPESTRKDARTEMERPPSRRSFAVEYSNEVVSRGISVQGCKNVLEHSGESSYESLPENKNQEMVIKDLHNYYQNIANKVDELKLIMEDAKKSKPQPSPVHNEPEPERGITGGAFRPRSNANPESKVNNVDAKKDTNNHSQYTRPTLSSPYVCEEDECSIQSCLSQFTALELLTGNNKVGCENCTERINGKDGKTVYTNATKRFLVSSPPAILILHLKRFQIGPRCMFRKMSKHVDFPTILDLAPFCAMDKLKKLPNVTRGQNELLYSLYGVVEHSGGMHGGHYVAYVKVRQPVKPGDPRWWFLPKSANIPAATANGDGDADSESDLSGYESGEGPGSTAEAPPGKWYYISDSMVSEVTEDKVLNAQAYLLFYERIY